MAEKRLTPIKAIRAKCIDCMCGQIYEIPKCPCDDCSLYPYRMGKDPYRKKPTEEQKAKMIAHLPWNNVKEHGSTILNVSEGKDTAKI